MNHHPTKAGLTICFAAIALFLTAGCASGSRGAAGKSSSSRVVVLDKSLGKLKEAFNAEPPKTKVLAILSPTCGGCVYGAKALQHEAKAAPPDIATTEMLIVWVNMLESDNEAEARNAAKRFHIPGARHFYDDRKEVGGRIMVEQFPTAMQDALAILPKEHPMRELVEERAKLKPEETPIWDSVLIYPPGSQWQAQSPKPVWWTKQTWYSGEEKPGEVTAAFWKESTHKAPVNSDWYLEAREAFQVARQQRSR